MIYLAIEFIDGTSYGVECNDFIVQESAIITRTSSRDIQDVIPLSNLKVATQIDESDYVTMMEAIGD